MSFKNLMKSYRHKINFTQKLYRLMGMSYAFQVTFRNISPSSTELAVFDLTHFIGTARNQVVIFVVPDEFDDFTTPPLSNVHMRPILYGSSSTQTNKK
ncbi:hypothetical protein H5410_056917 [Solanum commersonii]|uniref:Uncharacterized protein n=1 Tax=Solanum commersonii TaxID=4109 RepID=A0A9J5WNM4_SOLCO|nr:hypothetical protein H5410_056917 [Solanum commersonii]